MTRLTPHTSLAAFRLGLLLLAAAATLSCAAGQRPDHGQRRWLLSPSAEASYQYLIYLDASRKGQATEADAALSRVLELDQGLEVFLELSELKWRMGRPEEAEEVIRQGLPLHPGDKWLTLRLADVHRLQQQYDNAAKVLASYLETHPVDNDALLRQARIALELDRFGEARDILSRLPTDQILAEALYLRAKAESGLGQNRKAIASLRKALEKEPTHLAALIELAFLLETENDLAGAEGIYTRLLEQGESSPEVWIKLIDLSLKLNNPEKALALTSIGPQEKSFLLEAARLFLSHKFHDEAAEALAPLSTQEQADADVRFFLALLEFEGRNNPDAALAQLAGIPKDSPYHARGLAFMAQVLHFQEQTEPSLALLREAQAQYPDDKEFPELQAWILSSQGRSAEAEQVLEQALSRWPENISLLYRLGMALEDQGKSGPALEVMERVLVMDPNMADALNFVGYVLAEQNRDLGRAQELIQKALAMKPDSGYIIDSLAWVLYKRGEHQKAMVEIRKAVAMQPEDPTIWEHYGDIARALGKAKEARTGYRNALKQGSRHPERVKQKLEDL